MVFIDQSTPEAGGALLRQKMVDSGAPQSQVDAWAADKRQKMLDAGAPLDKVDAYWGITKPDPTLTNNTLAAELEPHAPAASNVWEDVVAGWNHSDLGLPLTSGQASFTHNPNAGPLDTIAEGAAQFVGDIPAAIEGGLGGALAGIPAGPGGIVRGATLGAVMWPAAMREMFIAKYNTTGPWTAKDVIATGVKAADAAASAGVGAIVAGGAGDAVSTGLQKVAGGLDAVSSKFIGMLGGAVAGSAAQSVVSGQGVPSAQDFLANAFLILGGEAFGHVVGAAANRRYQPNDRGSEVVQNLQDLYVRTGLTPDEITKLASVDEQVRQEVMRSRTAGNDQLTPALDAYAARAGRSTGKDFGPLPADPYEPLAVEPKPNPDAANTEPAPGFMKPEQVPQVQLDILKELEGSPDINGRAQVSPAGATGAYQIMPTTARAYGFNPDLLNDPAYNERAARTIAADLNNRFKGNEADILVAYNAGPTRANVWIRGGRDFYSLPPETQKYLIHAEQIGAIDEGFTRQAARVDIADEPSVQGGDMPAFPPNHNGGPPLEDTIPYYHGEKGLAPGEGGPRFVSPDRNYAENFRSNGEPNTVHRVDLTKAEAIQHGVYDEVNDIPINGEVPEEVAKRMREEAPSELPTKAQSDENMDKMIGAIDPPKSWAEKLNIGEIWQGFKFMLTPGHAFDRATGLEPGHSGMEDALRATLGVNGQADQFYSRGPIILGVDKDGAPTFTPTKGKNFVDSVYKYMASKGGNLADFDRYRIAMRTLEKAEQGIKTGFDVNDAKAQVNAPGAFEKYDAAHRAAQRVWDGVNDYSIAAGLITPDRVSAMNALNEEYVPFNRLMDDKYEPPRWGSPFGIKQPYRKIEGSARPLVPPAISEMDNLTQRVRMATRNVAVKFAINRMREIDPELATLVKISKNTAIKEVEEAKAALEDQDGIELPEEVKAAMEPFLTARELLASLAQTRGRSEADNDVIVFNNGEPEVWRINDPDLAKMIKASTGGPEDPLPGLLGAWARMTTSGIVSMPTFPFRALWHAAIEPAAFGEGGSSLPFHNMVNGTIAALMGDKAGRFFGGAYERFAANGGLGGTYNEVDRNFIVPKLRDVMNGSPLNIPSAIFNTMHHPVEVLRTAQHMVHNSMQVGAMIHSERAGMQTLRAAMLARKAGLDYADKFASPAIASFVRTVPFGATGFKDVQQVTQALADHPVGATLKAMAVLTLPTIILTLANRMADKDKEADDPDTWINQPQWERDNYWIFPAINGVRIKLPKPYVGGAFFATLPERLVNYVWDEAHGNSEQAGLDLENLAGGVLQRATPSFMPSFPLPILEQVTNHNFYLNRPLVPDALAKQSAYMQYGPNTSKTSIAIAGFLHQMHVNWSPMVLDNYVSEWLGTAPKAVWDEVGSVGSRITPEAIKISGIAAVAPEGEKGKVPEAADNPFFASFVTRNPGVGQIANDFYDRLAQVNAAKADLVRAKKDNDTAELTRAQANPLLGSNLVTVAKALAVMRGFLNRINATDTMTNQEKLKQTDELSKQMFQTARAAVWQTDRLIHSRDVPEVTPPSQGHLAK